MLGPRYPMPALWLTSRIDPVQTLWAVACLRQGNDAAQVSTASMLLPRFHGHSGFRDGAWSCHWDSLQLSNTARLFSAFGRASGGSMDVRMQVLQVTCFPAVPSCESAQYGVSPLSSARFWCPDSGAPLKMLYYYDETCNRSFPYS